MPPFEVKMNTINDFYCPICNSYTVYAITGNDISRTTKEVKKDTKCSSCGTVFCITWQIHSY